jgi:hypothetical protein
MRLVRSLYDAEAVLRRTAAVLQRLSRSDDRATPARPVMRVRTPALPSPAPTRRFSSARAAWLAALHRSREVMDVVQHALARRQAATEPGARFPDTR